MGILIKHIFKTITSIWLLLILFSCSSRDDQSAKNNYPVKIENVDSLKIVSNPSFPRDGKITYNLKEEISIGLAEGDENYILNRPFDVKVSENGTIYILDWGDVNIKVYDKHGRYLRIVGRKGQGPGEFDVPVYFDLSSDGKIYIMDSRFRRVAILDTLGKFISGFLLENGYHSGMKTDQNNYLYFSRNITLDVEDINSKISIHRYDSDGNEVLNFGEFINEKRIAVRTGEKSSISIGSRNMPTTVWGIDLSGRLFEGFNENYQIYVYDPDGKLGFRFEREFTPVPNVVEKRDRPNMTADQKRLIDKYLANLPKFKPAFKRKLVFDEKGNVWIQIYHGTDFEGTIYDVFSPGGIYLKQALVEHTIYEFKHGKVYSITRTEDGFRVVKRFRLAEKTE